MFTTLSAEDLGLNLTFAAAVEVAAAAGFEGVDLHMQEQVQEGRTAREIGRQLEDAGLRGGGWWLPVEFRESDDQFTSELASLGKSSAIARELGCPWCLTWVWPYSDQLAYDANLAVHAARLRRLAERLAQDGCRLGIEFIGSKTSQEGHPHPFVASLTQLTDLIQAVGANNVGLLLDSFQWYVSGGTIAQLGALTKDRVVYVHLADAPTGRAREEQIDNQRRLPGAGGVVDLTGFVRALDRLQLDCPIAVEPYDPDLSHLDALPRAKVARKSIDDVFEKAGVKLR